MAKYEILDKLLRSNKGFIRTSEATYVGISRSSFGDYVRGRGLVRVAHGLYQSSDVWDDPLYVIQLRYPKAVFSHETALYLHHLSEREPLQFSVTFKAGTNATGLTAEGIRVYKVKEALFEEGLSAIASPTGHQLRVYNPERTICDLFRSRRNIDTQELHAAVRSWLRQKKRNIPELLRYANAFSVGAIVKQYLEVLL